MNEVKRIVNSSISHPSRMRDMDGFGAKPSNRKIRNSLFTKNVSDNHYFNDFTAHLIKLEQKHLLLIV